MNAYFSLSDKVYDVTNRYPQLIDFLVNHGFKKLQNEMMRKTIGKTISLEAAFRSMGVDPALMEQQMIEVIEHGASLSSLEPSSNQNQQDGAIKLEGVLPCPIRLQILDHLENWIKQQDIAVNYELNAASMGLDWLEERVSQSADPSGLADIYLSAGFSLFFDRQLLEHHVKAGAFSDLTGLQQLNPSFDNQFIDLKDPRHQYSIVGVIPAIFMVNTQLLGDRPFPRSWADLMRPEFENTIALPMRDLDLFNAVLLGIYKVYGEEGVAKLGRSMMTSMHPAQMIKAGGRKQPEQAPVITVMPYFFTIMGQEKGPMEPVWPEDGAIISPIFLLTKAASREKIQPLVDFLCSKEMGEVFAADGKFPTTNPEVDNQLSEDQKFLWLGWDFIHSNDIGALLRKTEQIFLDAMEGKI